MDFEPKFELKFRPGQCILKSETIPAGSLGGDSLPELALACLGFRQMDVLSAEMHDAGEGEGV